MIEAVSQGNHDEIRELLSLGYSLSQRSREGQTALHLCVIFDDTPTAELLLDHDARIINTKNIDSLTPLALAIQKQSWHMASLLIERGCSLESFASTVFDWLPLELKTNLVSVRPVIHALAVRFGDREDKFSLVHRAIDKNELACLALFLEEGFDANGPEGETGMSLDCPPI